MTVTERQSAANPGRVLAGSAIDGLAQQVSVPGLAAVLLDEVADEPPQVGVVAIRVGDVHGCPSGSVPPAASADAKRALDRSNPLDTSQRGRQRATHRK